MSDLIISAVILMIIMLIFMFILLKNILHRMSVNAKKYFVHKFKNYEYILEEKQTKLNEVTEQLNEKKHKYDEIIKKINDEQIVGYDRDITKIKDDGINKEQHVNNVKNDLRVPQYRETYFFNNYKEIKKVFTVNNEQIIKDFIKEIENPAEEKQYKALEKIRNKFDNESIYNCSTLKIEEQKELISDVLTDRERKLIKLDEIINDEKFSIKFFIKFIDEKMEQLDPHIYVYTNGTNQKYELIDKRIIVVQYNNMSEGIILRFRDKIYDYSI